MTPATRRVLGWCVHAYTGTGLLVAAWVAVLLTAPDRTPDTYRHCFLLMLMATVIDATDGTFARWVRIKEAVPSFDGRRLDDLVDFLMYSCLPLFLVYRAGVMPADWEWTLLVALAASGYGFSQADIKTADGSFQGFPSYWNIVAFYLLVLPMPGWAAVAMVLGFSALTFVPTHYPYPTQPGRVNRLMLVLCVPWTLAVLWSLSHPWADGVGEVAKWSVVYPAFYLAVAWGMSLWRMLR